MSSRALQLIIGVDAKKAQSTFESIDPMLYRTELVRFEVHHRNFTDPWVEDRCLSASIGAASPTSVSWSKGSAEISMEEGQKRRLALSSSIAPA